MEIIYNWIDTVIDNGSWKKYNDLHLDEVYKSEKNKIGLKKGIVALKFANDYVKKNYPKYKIVLAFSRKSKETSTGVNFSNCDTFSE